MPPRLTPQFQECAANVGKKINALPVPAWRKSMPKKRAEVTLRRDFGMQTAIYKAITNEIRKKSQNDPKYQNKRRSFLDLKPREQSELIEKTLKKYLGDPVRILIKIVNRLNTPTQKVRNIVNDLNNPIQKIANGPQPQNNPNDPTNEFNQGNPNNPMNQRQARNMQNVETQDNENTQTVKVEDDQSYNNTQTEEANDEDNLAKDTLVSAAKLTAVVGTAAKLEHKLPTPKPGATNKDDQTSNKPKMSVKHEIKKDFRDVEETRHLEKGFKAVQKLLTGAKVLEKGAEEVISLVSKF